MNHSFSPLLCYIFVITGLVLIFTASFLAYKNMEFHSNSSLFEGYIEGYEQKISYSSQGEASTSYAYKIAYKTPDGLLRRFTNNAYLSAPALYIGARLPVRVHLGTNEAKMDFAVWRGPHLIGGVGILFSLIGLLPLLWARYTMNKERDLQQHGDRIQTTLKEVIMEEALINGDYMYHLILTGIDPQNGQEKEYKSEILLAESKPVIDKKTFNVYIDRKNPKKYRVDISGLDFIKQ